MIVYIFVLYPCLSPTRFVTSMTQLEKKMLENQRDRLLSTILTLLGIHFGVNILKSWKVNHFGFVEYLDQMTYS